MQKQDFETIKSKTLSRFWDPAKNFPRPLVFEVPFATPSVDVHILHMGNITWLTTYLFCSYMYL